MSCAICNNFRGTGELLSREDMKAKLREKIKIPNRKHTPKDLAWRSLLESAVDCYSCNILLTGCRGVFQQRSVDENEIVNFSIRFYYPNYMDHDPDLDKTISFLRKDGTYFDIQLFISGKDNDPTPPSWEPLPMSKRTSPRTDSAATMDLIETWMQNCEDDSDHEDCALEDDPELPKRVVDVGTDDESIRVTETDGQSAKYICLSHCWGLAQIITTTKATLEARQQNIAVTDLSKTFRDAVRLTRKLGIQYIWIDSLCIIQDDAKDWEIESAKMASIYSNGYLTIAATQSPNGAGGLYADTPDFEVSGKTPSGEDYRIFFREMIDHHLESVPTPNRSGTGLSILGHATVTRHPLLTRAWVYQERLLSPRIIHFGPYEIFFECFASAQCECGGIQHYGSSEDVSASLMKALYSEALNSEAEGVEWHEYAEYYLARVWRTMISSYTVLGITKSFDRLPALGGLARKTASVRKHEYIAGLWENTINDDLIWMVAGREQTRSPRAYPPTAPSWSWASTEAQIWYLDIIYYWDPEECMTEDERLPYEHFSTVESWTVNPTGAGEFGFVKEGTMEITGLVAEGVIERVEDEANKQEPVSYYIRFSPDLRLKMQPDYQFDFENPHRVLSETQVSCLRMSVVQESDTEYLVSLVLRPIKGTADFERIGTLLIKSAPPPVDPLGGIYTGDEEHTVTIR